MAAAPDGDKLLDRRTPQRSDQRRAALLHALDDLLREQTFDEISIADVAARAGVTRSAFYFYFENKAASAAALSAEMCQEVLAATDDLVTGDGTPRERVERVIAALLTSWRSHRHLFRAMVDARRRSPAVQGLWDDFRASFVAPLSTMIDAERAAGVAPPGPDSRALATVLLELNDRALEQLSDGDPLEPEQRAGALATVWLRTIYGTAADEHRSST
ncbi:TetR/AcrR family transcriptional regulator [Cryptosporangium aurantiacum]|uniref:Transcriptional regulator, TetR family n=1 Tax=Cryptosporangium aurantiacum TaxID=134849 RepID=A0A1M7TYM6_9ACTN|nr:TetR/AcrR family transcriptional regulator [Cryptosporangium aurantiacum]SHN75804.1 transcriptional regulator, TetR family [Cryptosporangium aurantiacum]